MTWTLKIARFLECYYHTSNNKLTCFNENYIAWWFYKFFSNKKLDPHTQLYYVSGELPTCALDLQEN